MTGPDHLSALALLSVGTTFRAFVLGVRWGIGHRRAAKASSPRRPEAVRELHLSRRFYILSPDALSPAQHSLGLFMVAIVFFLSSRRLDLDQVGRSGAAEALLPADLPGTPPPWPVLAFAAAAAAPRDRAAAPTDPVCPPLSAPRLPADHAVGWIMLGMGFIGAGPAAPQSKHGTRAPSRAPLPPRRDARPAPRAPYPGCPGAGLWNTRSWWLSARQRAEAAKALASAGDGAGARRGSSRCVGRERARAPTAAAAASPLASPPVAAQLAARSRARLVLTSAGVLCPQGRGRRVRGRGD